LAASAGLVVYNEVLGQTCVNAQVALNDSVTSGSPGSAISEGSYEHFNQSVHLLAG